jgi:hypothetical protein
MRGTEFITVKFELYSVNKMNENVYATSTPVRYCRPFSTNCYCETRGDFASLPSLTPTHRDKKKTIFNPQISNKSSPKYLPGKN